MKLGRSVLIAALLTKLILSGEHSCVDNSIGCWYNTLEQCNASTRAGEQDSKSTTWDGVRCQDWATKVPHNIASWLESYRENYCIFESGEAIPWCYTTNEDARWDYCYKSCESLKMGCHDLDKDCWHSDWLFCREFWSYIGTKNTTKDGDVCERWSDMTEEKYSKHGRYQRCTMLESSTPWCYSSNTLTNVHCFAECVPSPEPTIRFNVDESINVVTETAVASTTSYTTIGTSSLWVTVSTVAKEISTAATSWETGTGRLEETVTTVDAAKPAATTTQVASATGMEVFETTRAIEASRDDPLGGTAVHAIANGAQALGCITLLTLLGITIIVFIIRRDFSPERVIHLGEEASLFAAHVCILLFRDRTEQPAMCAIVAGTLQYCFTVNFLFMLLESVHSLTISQNLVNEGSLASTKKLLAIGWGIPIVSTTVTMITYYDSLTSDWSCWLNLGGRVCYATVVPVLILATISLILAEEGTMNQHPRLPLGNKHQKWAAMVNQRGLMILAPLQIAAWLIGACAVYHRRLPWYPIVFVLNVSLGSVIFQFHCLGNPEAMKQLETWWHRLKSAYGERMRKTK